MNPSFGITPLTLSDLPEALSLSTQAGWNQLPADWRRLVELWPETCFAGRIDDRLIATGTLATYAPGVGWIGMILVDERHRRRGFGARIMDHLIDTAARRNIPALGLDASEFGRPVYLKKGFRDVRNFDRWVAPAPGTCPATPPTVRSMTGEDHRWMLALDRQSTGWDRSALLTRLGQEPGVKALVVHESDGRSGFAFRRPGRVASYAGPVIADSAETAGTLALALLAGMKPDEKLFMDVPHGNRLTRWLHENGFAVARSLTRMERGALPLPSVNAERVYAIGAFELG